MADSVKVSLTTLIDLALCTPEVGAVNFNILRTFLLLLLKELRMNNLAVQLSGPEYAATIKEIKIQEKIAESAKEHEATKVSFADTKGPTGATGAIGATGAAGATGAGADAFGMDGGVRVSGDDSQRPSQEYDFTRDTPGSEGTEEKQFGLLGGPGGAESGEIILSLRNDVNSIRKDVDQIIENITIISELTEKVPFEELYNSVKEIDDLKSKLEELTVKLSEKSDQEGDEAGGEEKEDPVKAQLRELHEKLNALNDQVQGLDSNFSSQIDGLIEQIGALECDLGRLMEQMNTDQPEEDAMAQDFTGLGELQSRLQQLQYDMEHVNQVTTKLMDDEQERQLRYEALVEQVEVLKMVKADREVVEDALAEKADQVVVNRKVSHEQFDNACDDLARGLDEAFTKLCQQETLWKNALDDVQNEIGQKLDKVELTPLRDFIQQRLKILQEKLKALAARKELEAAGTKKFLRDVNCISCDKDVVMKRKQDIPNVPIQPSLPPARSIRPYVTYELDKLRQQQKRPMGKNMIQLEDMEQEYDKKTRKEKPEEEPEHLVNRYCGGSHTIIAPHQRVLRTGQATQSSPEALGYTEISIRGTDGQLYLGQEMSLKRPDVTEATQTSAIVFKTSSKEGPATKGDTKAIKSPKSPVKTPKSPKSVRQSSKGSKVAFTEPQPESPAAQGS